MAVTWPTGHTWECYLVELLDADYASQGELHNAKNLKFNPMLYGQGAFSFSLHEQDEYAGKIKDALANQTRYFIRVERDGSYVFGGIVERINRKYEISGRGTQYLEVSGRALAYMLHWRHGLPIAPAENLKTTDKVDNVFKWFVERTFGATAPDSPDGITRTDASFLIDDDKDEYPTNVELNATKRNMFDYLQKRGAHFDVDFDVQFVLDSGSYKPKFYTWYPRRGKDRAVGNGDGNKAVVINDAGDNVHSANIYIDLYDAQTSRMDATLLHEETDSTLETNLKRIEGMSTSSGPNTIAVELTDRAPKIGYEQDFVETEDCQWDPTGTLDYGFDVGDQITYNNQYLGFDAVDATIAEIQVEIDDDGIEHLKLIFGDPEPKFFDKVKGGRVIGDLDFEGSAVAALRDDDGDRAWFAEDASLPVIGDGSYIETNATTATIGGVLYDVIQVSAAGALLGHNLLSTTHPDTVPDTPVQGDLIIGNSTPAWQRLALGAGDTYLHSTGTNAEWATIDHSHLTNVTEDQHHAAFVGLKGDNATIVGPDGDNAVTVQSDTDGYLFTEDVGSNALDFTGPWTRFDAGSADYALRPTTYADDLRIQSAAGTDEVWIEGDTGKSHWDDDMYVGDAAGAASGKVHIKDTVRDYSGIVVESTGGQQGDFGIVQAGILVMRNWTEGKSLSFQIYGDYEMAHAHGDGTAWTFRNGIDVQGWKEAESDIRWELDSSTGDLWLDSAATTTFGGYELTWPTSGAVVGDALTISAVSGSDVTLAYTALSPSMLGNGTAQWQIPVTGSTPFAPSWMTMVSDTAGANQKPLMSDASGFLTIEKLMVTDTLSYFDGDKLQLGHADYYLEKSSGSTTVVSGGGWGLDLAYQGAAKLRLQGDLLFPLTTLTVDLGSSSYRYGSIYCDEVNLSTYGANTGNFWTVSGTESYNASIYYGGVSAAVAYTIYWGADNDYDYVYMKDGSGGTPTWVACTTGRLYHGGQQHRHYLT